MASNPNNNLRGGGTLGLGLCEWGPLATLASLPPQAGRWEGDGLHPVDGWLAKNSAYCSGDCKMTTTPPPGSGLLPIVIEMVPIRVPIARSSPVIATMSFDQRDMRREYSPILGLCKWSLSLPSTGCAPPHRSSRLPRSSSSGSLAALGCNRRVSPSPPTAGRKRWSRGRRSVWLAGR